MLERLECGDITLTTVTVLAPHLTLENHESLLHAATHLGKSEVERLVGRVHPQPDIAATVRKLPTTSAGQTVSEPLQSTMHLPQSSRPTVTPLAPERFLIKVTIGADARANLRRAQDLLRHVIPSGDPAQIVERALKSLVDQLERRAAERRRRTCHCAAVRTMRTNISSLGTLGRLPRRFPGTTVVPASGRLQLPLVHRNPITMLAPIQIDRLGIASRV